MIDYKKLPAHLQDGVQRWVEHGIIPGNFLSAVILNQLGQAIAYADETSRERLNDIVQFFHWELPSTCWGSEAKMAAWHKQGGADGEEE